ncbi:MAG: hypothetical protein UT50_C0018G0007 [Candidatus Moranbacteria bacterium GW2011_GWA2_39_41]|nr:MAG: hypothetical protein UT50_C0018G0007 [Candidatus Moranbacteria bacterium GW2011_GWA2_39_41]
MHFGRGNRTGRSELENLRRNFRSERRQIRAKENDVPPIIKSRLLGISSLSSDVYYNREEIYLTASFRDLPAVNFGTVIAGIWIEAFV